MIKSCSCAIVKSMDLLAAFCERKNFPAVQNTLLLAVAAVVARYVAHMSLRRFRVCPTCLRDVSSPAHVSSQRRVSSPGLFSGSVFARPRVLATTRVFARPVFGKCLRPPTRLRNGACLRTPTCLRDDACLRPTCLRQLSSRAHMASQLEVPWRAREVLSDAHMSSLREVSSRGMSLQTPTCLRCLACVC